MQKAVSRISTAILGVIGLLCFGVIAECSSEVGRYYGWFSARVASVLGVLGLVFLAAGGLAIAALLIFVAATLLAKISARHPEAVPRGRDRHGR